MSVPSGIPAIPGIPGIPGAKKLPVATRKPDVRRADTSSSILVKWLMKKYHITSAQEGKGGESRCNQKACGHKLAFFMPLHKDPEIYHYDDFVLRINEALKNCIEDADNPMVTLLNFSASVNQNMAPHFFHGAISRVTNYKTKEEYIRSRHLLDYVIEIEKRLIVKISEPKLNDITQYLKQKNDLIQQKLAAKNEYEPRSIEVINNKLKNKQEDNIYKLMSNFIQHNQSLDDIKNILALLNTYKATLPNDCNFAQRIFDAWLETQDKNTVNTADWGQKIIAPLKINNCSHELIQHIEEAAMKFDPSVLNTKALDSDFDRLPEQWRRELIDILKPPKFLKELTAESDEQRGERLIGALQQDLCIDSLEGISKLTDVSKWIKSLSDQDKDGYSVQANRLLTLVDKWLKESSVTEDELYTILANCPPHWQEKLMTTFIKANFERRLSLGVEKYFLWLSQLSDPASAPDNDNRKHHLVCLFLESDRTSVEDAKSNFDFVLDKLSMKKPFLDSTTLALRTQLVIKHIKALTASGWLSDDDREYVATLIDKAGLILDQRLLIGHEIYGPSFTTAVAQSGIFSTFKQLSEAPFDSNKSEEVKDSLLQGEPSWETKYSLFFQRKAFTSNTFSLRQKRLEMAVSWIKEGDEKCVRENILGVIEAFSEASFIPKEARKNRWGFIKRGSTEYDTAEPWQVKDFLITAFSKRFKKEDMGDQLFESLKAAMSDYAKKQFTILSEELLVKPGAKVVETKTKTETGTEFTFVDAILESNERFDVLTQAIHNPIAVEPLPEELNLDVLNNLPDVPSAIPIPAEPTNDEHEEEQENQPVLS